MSDPLEEALQRVKAGSCNEADLRLIADAIQIGQLAPVLRNASVGVAGDLVDSLVITGNHNIVGSNNIVIQGDAATVIKNLLLQPSNFTQAPFSLDDLVQQVRSRVSEKILNLFSKIRLLNKRHIEVEQLYVNVYVLEKQDFRATIPGLLEGRDAREQFDRFGLGKRGERSPGLVIAASKDFPRLMVLGKPGSGKSTFSRYLAVSCAKGECLGDYIPVLLELRDVDDAAFNLFQWIHEEFELEQEAQTEKLLKQGKGLILLDGLDEVPSLVQQKVQSELRKFTKRYDKNRFILTCRTQTTEYIPEQFQAVEVADFSPEQVEFFALNWFTATAETPKQGMELKDHFMEKLGESPQTGELAVTPVLLSLTCWIFDDLKSLPEKRSDLYRDGLNLLLQQWDEGRGINRDSECDRYQQMSVEERRELLSYLAVRKFEQEDNFVLFEETEICDYIAEYLHISCREERDVLKAIALQHGLLVERAQRIWSFSHLSFQEFLVASALCEKSDWRKLLDYLGKPHWNEVFLLVIEMLPNADFLLKIMKERIDLLMAENNKCQNFMKWVKIKSETIQVPYKLSATRAFYFQASVDEGITHGGLAAALDPNYREIVFNYKDRNWLSKVALDFALDSYLSRAFSQVFSFLLFTHSFDAVFNLKLSDKFLRDLQPIVRSLRFELPKPDIVENDGKICRDFTQVEKWWQGNHHYWTEKLREIVIYNRNICHLWNFDDDEKNLLRHYYELNRLLIKCLRIGSISFQVQENIEKDLFLPIIEVGRTEA